MLKFQEIQLLKQRVDILNASNSPIKDVLQLQEEISHSLIAPVEAHPSFSISPFSSSIDADSNVIIFSQKTGSVRVRC